MVQVLVPLGVLGALAFVGGMVSAVVGGSGSGSTVAVGSQVDAGPVKLSVEGWRNAGAEFDVYVKEVADQDNAPCLATTDAYLLINGQHVDANGGSASCDALNTGESGVAGFRWFLSNGVPRHVQIVLAPGGGAVGRINVNASTQCAGVGCP